MNRSNWAAVVICAIALAALCFAISVRFSSAETVAGIELSLDREAEIRAKQKELAADAAAMTAKEAQYRSEIDESREKMRSAFVRNQKSRRIRAQEERERLRVSTSRLHGYCVAWRDRALLNLKGVSLDVQGRVHSLGIDPVGRSYVTLEGMQSQPGVKVVVPEKLRRQLQGFRVGEEVRLDAVTLEEVRFDGSAFMVGSNYVFKPEVVRTISWPHDGWRVRLRGPETPIYEDQGMRRQMDSLSADYLPALGLYHREDSTFVYRARYPRIGGWVSNSAIAE